MKFSIAIWLLRIPLYLWDTNSIPMRLILWCDCFMFHFICVIRVSFRCLSCLSFYEMYIHCLRFVWIVFLVGVLFDCMVVPDTHHMSVVIYFHTDNASTPMSDPISDLLCLLIASLLEVLPVSYFACFCYGLLSVRYSFFSLLLFPHFTAFLRTGVPIVSFWRAFF